MQIGRRAKSQAAASALASLTNSAGIDEVVRYLRQQGDVVVGDGPCMFLINGRFRLDFEQLQHRANRMRRRQQKPEFQIGERPTARCKAGSAPRLPAPIDS